MLRREPEASAEEQRGHERDRSHRDHRQLLSRQFLRCLVLLEFCEFPPQLNLTKENLGVRVYHVGALPCFSFSHWSKQMGQSDPPRQIPVGIVAGLTHEAKERAMRNFITTP